MRIPRGFGFVVPQSFDGESERSHQLLACTFVHQKFPGRVPEGAMLLRAFFGGHSGEALLGETDDKLVERARLQLSRVLGSLPEASETVVRRWPHSMPQYAVGHLDRMAELESMLNTMPGLHLVGSAYHGVGLPDLIRQGRAIARLLAGQTRSRFDASSNLRLFPPSVRSTMPGAPFKPCFGLSGISRLTIPAQLAFSENDFRLSKKNPHNSILLESVDIAP